MSAPAIDAPDALSRLIPSRVARGFAIAVVSGLFFTGLNASVKELASEMPPLYVLVGPLDRGLALIAPIMLWRVGHAGAATRDLKLHCLPRPVPHAAAMGCGTRPSSGCRSPPWRRWASPGRSSSPWAPSCSCGETVQARRWAAVAIGFVGMLVIVRPGFMPS